MTELTGKRALVTGGSRGIGASIALALAHKGADVAISYERSADRAQQVVDRIQGLGRRAIAIQADASDPDAVKRLVATAVEGIGGIDILVNNAGTFRPSAIADATLDDIDTLLNVNVRGPVLTTQAAIPHLATGGRVITIGSNLAERVPFPGLTLYSMTKSAHLAFTRGLARELGAKDITVNLVQPGPIDTELNPADGASADSNRSLVALGRYGATDELAAVVLFLASPAASFVTGSVITADGGYNA
jgi:NAD(P)-dependent dehydrogenase (short-subunit alcohol dehydrogenase family)